MPKTRNSLRVKVDADNNRLYIFIAGEVTKSSLDQFFTEVRFGIADLKTDFSVITDLTECHIGHLSAVPTFRKIMHYVSTQGVKEVIRVVDTDNLIYQQAINLESQIQGYSPRYVSSLDEAEQHLDGETRRNSLRFNLINKKIEITTESLSSTGELIDISTTGCAIKTAETIPIGQEMRVKLSLSGKKSVLKEFELDAVASRLFDGGVAVAFVDIDDSDTEMLRECLVQESKSDM